MLTNYDLIDLEAVLLNMRLNIKSTVNVQILEKLIRLFETEQQNLEEQICKDDDDNQIRHALADISALGTIDNYHFIFHDNIYAGSYLFLADCNVIQGFAVTFHLINQLLSNQNYDRAFSIIDDIHDFPCILIQHQMHPTKQISNYIKKAKTMSA